MMIDANMYWFPEHLFDDQDALAAFLSEIPSDSGTKGYVVNEARRKQVVIEKPEGYQNLNYVQGEYTLERQLSDMDKAGIEKAILKVPGAHEWMSLASCKMFNDGMAAYAKESKGRLCPLAVVPPYASKECFAEVDRCSNELGFHGIQLCAHYGEHYLDDTQFAPFFEKLNEQKRTIYIHHVSVPVQYDSLYEYNNLRRSYGRCVDQTTAVCRELCSGFFDKYPNLTLVHSMLGGGFFAIANMLFPTKSKDDDKAQRFHVYNQEKEQFNKHIYFEMSHAQPWGKEQLECAIKVLGSDHILFGTSYPVRKEWLLEGVDFIKSLNVSETAKAKILGGNACELYHIDK